MDANAARFGGAAINRVESVYPIRTQATTGVLPLRMRSVDTRYHVSELVRLRFGNNELDAASRLLWHDGREARLSTKAFDLLVLLVERRPEVVRKPEIKERLWPETFVSETNLPTLVGEIRDALGDDAREGRFVRTVHGVGYAFSAEVLVQGAVGADGESAPAWLVGTTRITLARGENVLGREGTDVIPLHSPTVSRRHARVTVSAGEAIVEDLDSKNGTYVNQSRVTAPVHVRDGDAVRLGSLTFAIRFARAGTSTQTI